MVCSWLRCTGFNIMNESLKNQLIRHEGLRLKPYKCTANKTTIGVGRNLDDVGISEDEAMLLLENDIKKIKEQAEKFPWFLKLNESRQNVVLNMIFNLGLNGFLKFKETMHYLESGQYDQAAIEMLESAWADQVGSRAKELSKTMFDGF